MASAQLIEVGIVLGILTIFTIISWGKKSLDKEGIFAGNIVGIAVYLLGGFSAFYIAILFFTFAEISTKIARINNPKKHEIRTTENIIGNSASAIIALALGSVTGFYGAMSAALSDTLSSEIGLLSSKKPVLITTFEEVDHGTDGGITTLGLLAGFFGSIIIASMNFIIFGNLALVGIIIISGMVGTITDSILGAAFERKKKLTNTQVNFFGSATGAITAVVLSMLIL